MGDTKTIIKDKNETFFIPQYHNETIMCNLSEILNKYEINNFNSIHQGFNDLIEFKGIITIPYAWSTWALFEYISLNMVVFLPYNPFNTLHSTVGTLPIRPPPPLHRVILPCQLHNKEMGYK